MPELPEVETIKMQLNRFLVGHKIEAVEIKTKKVFPDNPQLILGAKIIRVRRFGKLLVIDLDNGFSLLMHLKLTGQPLYRGPNLTSPPPLSPKVFGGIPGKHTHITFKLDRGGFLYFNDLRQFGWIKIEKTEGLERNNQYLKELGPEPPVGTELTPGHDFLSLSCFREILSKTRRAVKIVLMDQTKIAGVGNIYANDALWLAGINPQRPAKSLISSEQEKLYDSIIKVLKTGIKMGGSSEDTFVTPDGAEGHYQDYTLVYGRAGKKCRRCGAEIKKIQLGGRGTYFCPNCQK